MHELQELAEEQAREEVLRQAVPTAAAEVQTGQTADIGAARVSRVGYAPIVRLDKARREIELCATSEAVDSYGTIFDYEASKSAFSRWIGNVREMHERKAVGRRVGVRFDDAAKKVFVTIRISRGAQDTWEKVLDGTLRGASIGASNVTWELALLPDAQGQRVQVARAYDLVELSLVDNPSNPDALGITFVRDAAPDLALLDRLEDGDPTALAIESAERTRSEEGRDAAGSQAPAAVSARLHEAALAVLAGCGCALCMAATAALDDPTSEDAHAEVERGSGMETTLKTNRMREAALARAVGAGLRASAERLERLDIGMRELRTEMAGALREASEQMSARVRQMVDAVSRELTREMAGASGELVRRLERLEAQPMPGGPAARAVDKTHALGERNGGPAGQPGPAEQYRALEALAGRLADPQAQIAVAAELIRLQRDGAGIY